jgi:hypothetical protein
MVAYTPHAFFESSSQKMLGSSYLYPFEERSISSRRMSSN